ncbi:MAG: polymorphic toxin-type HINT domain-containing protein [Oscillospiraceae bacterium]|nr:polymorphic toxin-type HINT domain-containing protein [Oscillospiraceae bacterium]
MHKNKIFKKATAGVLSFLMAAQVMIFGDGTAQGILHADTFAEAAESIEKLNEKQQLAEEFKEKVSRLGEINYFDIPDETSLFSMRSQGPEELDFGSEEEIMSLEAGTGIPIIPYDLPEVSGSLTVTGSVSLSDERDCSKAKVFLFDSEWQVAAETTVNADGSFTVSASGLSSMSTHIKLECDGYLPRFYDGMGYGSYDIEENILFFGDTRYNAAENNQWSDNVIDQNDAAFVWECIGERRASGNYDATFDLNNDGKIDSDNDLNQIRQNYLNKNSEDEGYSAEYDINNDGLIDEYDLQYIQENYVGSCTTSPDYYEYMDIDNDGEIDQDDYSYFYNQLEALNGLNSSDYQDIFGNNITLNGNCRNDYMELYNAFLDLNGYSLDVTENFIFRTRDANLWEEGTGAVLYMNGGRLHVGGEFHFGQAGCDDIIYMQNENDILWLDGNWLYTTIADFEEEAAWIAGIIYFYGDHWLVNERSGEKSVWSDGTHKILLYNPNGLQTIHWDNPERNIYNTTRQLNFDYVDDEGNCIGIIFPYGYSPELYEIHPWFEITEDEEPDYTLYRRGWEIGDGVHIATGNYSKSFVDMSSKAPGMSLDFVRTYNSMNTEEGSFGVGWDFNIDVSKIISPAAGIYQVVLPDGSNSTFKEENGVFENLNNHNKMVRDTNNNFVITIPSQIKYHFNSSNELCQIEDSDGNTITVSPIENNVRTITDLSGGLYKITYDSSGEHKRVISIENYKSDQLVRSVNYTYDSQNRLDSVRSVLEGYEYYDYDGNSYLKKITNHYNETVEQVEYFSDGKVNYITNSLGLRQVYQYNPSGKQTGVVEYDNGNYIKTTQYDYDEKYAVKLNKVYTDGTEYIIENAEYSKDANGKNKYDEIIRYTDEKGNVTLTDYDDNGNVIKTTLPDGTFTSSLYDELNNLILSVDANNNLVINVYDGTRITRSAQSLTTVSDDAVNQAKSNPKSYFENHISEFAVTQYEYYGDTDYTIKGLLKKTTDPEGNVTEYKYNPDGTVSEMFNYGAGETHPEHGVRYEYNDLFLAEKTISAEGFVTEMRYDKAGNVTDTIVYGKPVNGELTQTPAEIKIEYDVLGREVKKIAPNYAADGNKFTATSYYPGGLTKSVTDSEGHTTNFFYNAYGNLIKTVNPDGTQSLTEYDGLGREKSTHFKSSENSDRLILTSTSYEIINNYNFKVYGSNDRTYNAYKTTKVQYITEDKQVTTDIITDCNGNTVAEYVNEQLKRENTYYANGQLGTQTYDPENDENGNHTTKYKYEYLNKLTETQTPFFDDGGNIRYSVTKNSYYKNGKEKTTETNSQLQDDDTQKWNKTEFWYDNLGNLVMTAVYADDCDDTYTKYFYDKDSIKTSMVTGMTSPDDLNKLVTTYIYDNRNQLISTEESINGTTIHNSGTLLYDLNGNIISSHDANGNVTTKTYDSLNNVISSVSVCPADSSKNTSVYYQYDNMGRVVNVSGNSETTSFVYDALGRVVKEIGSYFKGYSYVGSTSNIDNVFTGVNNLIVYSNETYEYDDEMRISKVYEGGTETVEYTYDNAGNKATASYNNGVTSSYTYNLSNMITGITNSNGSEYTYTYYLNGSDACKKRYENGIIEESYYEYDDFGRLKTETEITGENQNTISYEYDCYGNRAKMTVAGDDENYYTDYQYDVDGNYTTLLQKEVKHTGDVVQETAYTYDANGNQLSKNNPDEGLQNNVYNSINQLISIQNGEKTASYTYGYDGLRNSKTVNGQTTNHIWVNGQITVDTTDDTYVADIYSRGTGLVCTYERNYTAYGNRIYYLQNAHGDTVNLVDESGNKTKTYRYDAFGVEKNSDDADENPFRYCGEYFDKETNTIYLRARYYDPSIGRFITRDTYTGNGQDPLSLNLYTYCRNNPIIFTDESGHVFNLAAAAVGAAIGAAINVGVMAIGDAISGETHTAAEYAATAAAGAIGGLAAGFTLGGSVVAQVAGEIAIDAALGATSSVVEQAIVKKEVNWSDVGMSALSSGLCTGVNIGARRAVSNITPFCIGGAASKGCFTAGTLVETIDGDKPIEAVQTGDYVLSSDPETGKTAYKEVVNTFIHVKDTLVYITINDEVIETTEEHPFWIEGQGWTNAKNLNAGDIVRDKNGNNLNINNVEILKLPENEYVAVYNFEVAEYHTYYVSEFDVLVHNWCKKDIEMLRAGHDYEASSIKEAREMLRAMPDLAPPALGKINPLFSDPRGTYRGDLFNAIETNEKTKERYIADYVHNPNRVTKHPEHGKYPHYNLTFLNGKKAAIIIKEK